MAQVKDWMALADPDEEWETVSHFKLPLPVTLPTTIAQLTLSQAVKEQMGGQAPNLGLFPDINSLRTWISNAKQAMTTQMGPTISGIAEQDESVTMRDGAKITCRIYRPETPPKNGSPLVVIYRSSLVVSKTVGHMLTVDPTLRWWRLVYRRLGE